jgi:hypothetical protein
LAATLAEQAKSGTILAAKVLAAMLTLILLSAGLYFVNIGERRGVMLGVAMLVPAVAVLLSTTSRWAKWFFAACCGNAMRFLVMSTMGRTIGPPSLSAPRSFFLELAVIALLMAWLTQRFVKTKPGLLDSFSLVGGLMATVYSVLSPQPMRWLLAAVLLLGISFAASYFGTWKHNAR